MTAEKNEIIRQHLSISGWVQGVGFRYRAKYAAGEMGVTGWVRNVWDGTVEMEAQGTRGQINRMLDLIAQSRYIRIGGVERHEIPLEEHETGFHVR